ncbi:Zn-ribbon domain-containing OB-fold protein [Mycobacterium colombiense]
MSALIAQDLFRVEGERAVLLGSRRTSVGVVKFPAERPELFDARPEIQQDIAPVELSTTGTLFTYTTQEFAPPLPYRGDRSPEHFQPYIVGYIELPEGLLVETLIVGVNAGDLRIGQPMRSTTTTVRFTDGQDYLTYAFTPA